MTRTGGSRADQYHPLRPASYLRAGCRDGDLVNQGGTQQLWQVNIKDNVGRLIVHGELRPRLRQPAVCGSGGRARGVDQRAGYPTGGACAFSTTVFHEVFTGNGVRVIKTPVRRLGRIPLRSGMWGRYGANTSTTC
jgi:hypothetical protein